MLNSRDIDLLRPDVAYNCRKMIEIAKKDGWPVLVTGTVRDEEYQRYVYNKGTANTPYPSFHADHAGLAFDICKNVKGEEYSDNAFWNYCAKLGKKMGFTWGGDWKSIVDKPHFQWDEHGKYTSSMIRAHKYPAEMPKYGDDYMTKEEILAELGDKYIEKFSDLPEWAKADMRELLDSGIINGGTDKSVDSEDINMFLSDIKTVIINKRMMAK